MNTKVTFVVVPEQPPKVINCLRVYFCLYFSIFIYITFFVGTLNIGILESVMWGYWMGGRAWRRHHTQGKKDLWGQAWRYLCITLLTGHSITCMEYGGHWSTVAEEGEDIGFVNRQWSRYTQNEKAGGSLQGNIMILFLIHPYPSMHLILAFPPTNHLAG